MNGRLLKYGLWGKLHEESEELAMRAEALRHNPEAANAMYTRAAQKEHQVLNHIPREGILGEFYELFVVSAAALYFK